MKKKVIKKIINQMIPREYYWVNKILVRLAEVVGEEVLRAIFRKMKLRSNRKGEMANVSCKRDDFQRSL